MKNHPFNNEANQLNILATGSRLTVINWLCWNDDNGIFQMMTVLMKIFPF